MMAQMVRGSSRECEGQRGESRHLAVFFPLLGVRDMCVREESHFVSLAFWSVGERWNKRTKEKERRK